MSKKEGMPIQCFACINRKRLINSKAGKMTCRAYKIILTEKEMLALQKRCEGFIPHKKHEGL